MKARIMFRNGADVIVEMDKLTITYNNEGQVTAFNYSAPEEGTGEYLQFMDPSQIMCVTNFYEEHRPK